MPPRIDPRLGEFAQQMRRAPTAAERTLWRALSASRLDGLKFRRQSVLGTVIADFYCPAAALIVEIDGNTHDVDRDARRDAALAARGMLTVRFSNAEVAENLAGVLATIVAAAAPRRPGAPGLEREGLGVSAADGLPSALRIDSPTPDPSLEREGRI